MRYARKQLLSKIERTAIPVMAATAIRRLIVTGQLKDGERLVERELASSLGVGRTPVREALARLHRDGFVVEHPARGLLVSYLSEDEVRDIYQTLAALERAALRHTSRIPSTMLRQLDQAGRERRAAGSNFQRLVSADRSWHEAITGFTSNRMIVTALAAPRALAERYERAFFSNLSNPDRSGEEHREIELAIKAGKMAAAADLLERHWLGNIDAMAAAVHKQTEG